MPATLFGTSGIRGSATELFTNQFCFDLGRTFAKFLSKNKLAGPVAVGMDPRGSSPRIKDNIEQGLAYEGREISDQGATSVPSMCYILQQKKNLAGSLMVTGSHIKAYLNGVKFFAAREEITKKEETQIDALYQSLKAKVDFTQRKIAVSAEEDAKEEYKELLRGLAVTYPKWRVVVDTGDGSQSDIIPIVLTNLGLDVVELHTTIQGEFFARDTENREDFEEITTVIPREKAAFGMAFDSDGDRVIFFNKEGTFIPGDYTAALVAKYAPGDTVVTPVATSQVVDYIGKKVIRTKVGSPHIIKAMKEHRAKFAFEANGGGVSAEIMYTRDGGSTAIKFLNILARNNWTLEEAVATLPKFYLVKTKVDYEWDLKEKIVQAAKEKFGKGEIDETDGLKIWIDDTTWILFRSSQNAPEFRVFAESTDENVAKKLLADGSALVNAVINHA